MMQLELFLISPETSIHDAMASIDRNASGIVLVADKERNLIGTITDGDIRRAILARTKLSLPVSVLLAAKAASPSYSKPISVPEGTSETECLSVMRKYAIRHLPVLDGRGRIVNIVLHSNVAKDPLGSLQAVLMAGGFGKRLLPLTEDIPKPMLPVGDRPLLERIVDQLREVGIRDMTVTTHYLPEKITEHFGDGSDFGVNMKYITEDRPLGTAGSLGMMERPEGTMLVMNGDVLTKVDLGAMMKFHREHEATMTVAIRQFDIQVPFGVLECEGARVTGIEEKPIVSMFVNSGIYMMEPDVYDYIPKEERLDMPDLIERLLAAGRTVVSFPVFEYWLDVGRAADYEKARHDVEGDKKE